jgi:DNA-binding IclR family transcriptional regulator
MIELVERTGETAFLMIRDGLHALCIERVEGEHVQSLALKLGGTLPLHLGAGPRVLLAFAPAEVQRQYLAQEPLRAFTLKTIHDPEALRADIAGIQSTGYALSYEDVTIGVAAIGVPLFNHKSEVVGALSLSGITPRWTESHIAEMLVELRSVGVQISSRMGWRSDGTGGREQSAVPASGGPKSATHP